MALPPVFQKLLAGPSNATAAQKAVEAARKQRELEIDEAAEREAMMMLRGSRRIKQRKW